MVRFTHLALFATNMIVLEMLREMNYVGSLWYRYLPGDLGKILFFSLVSSLLIAPILAAILVSRWFLLWVLSFPALYIFFLLSEGN